VLIETVLIVTVPILTVLIVTVPVITVLIVAGLLVTVLIETAPMVRVLAIAGTHALQIHSELPRPLLAEAARLLAARLADSAPLILGTAAQALGLLGLPGPCPCPRGAGAPQPHGHRGCARGLHWGADREQQHGWCEQWG